MGVTAEKIALLNFLKDRLKGSQGSRLDWQKLVFFVFNQLKLNLFLP